MQNLEELVSLANTLPFEVDFWKVQNIYHDLLKAVYPEYRNQAGKDGGNAQTWVDLFNVLGEKLYCCRID